MIAPKSFRYEERGGAARITLTRPAKKNALTFEVYRELTDTFHALRKSDVRAISITGEGSGFCSGGDVEDIIGPLLAIAFSGEIALGEFLVGPAGGTGAALAAGGPITPAARGSVVFIVIAGHEWSRFGYR